jgi:hypothetical protein
VKAAQLAEVRAASKRERAHHADNVRLGCAHPACYCDECITDRVTVAAAAPWLLECLDSATTSLPGSAGDLS